MNPRVGTHINFTTEETLTEIILSLNDLVEGYNIPNFQIYLGSRTGANMRSFSKKDMEDSLDIIGNRGFFIHSGLTNYLSSRINFRRFVERRTKQELKTVKPFPLSGVVTHPGTKNSGGIIMELEETLDNIVDNIYKIYKEGNEDLGYLFLENAAGEGYKVFKNIDEMKYVIKKLEGKYDVNGQSIARNIKICIDTCHLFAAGDYNISKISEIKKFKKDFSKEIGMKYLKLIHLNDSKHEFGCRKDAHEIIGKGYLWKSPKILKAFFQEFKNIPYLCETRNFGECLPYIEKAKELLNR